MSICTCAVCGEQFTALSTFDKHQDVDFSRRPAVQCLPPQAVGLVQDSRQRWHAPGTDASRERIRQLAVTRDTHVVQAKSL
jgi:hypothetical protein